MNEKNVSLKSNFIEKSLISLKSWLKTYLIFVEWFSRRDVPCCWRKTRFLWCLHEEVILELKSKFYYEIFGTKNVTRNLWQIFLTYLWQASECLCLSNWNCRQGPRPKLKPWSSIWPRWTFLSVRLNYKDHVNKKHHEFTVKSIHYYNYQFDSNIVLIVVIIIGAARNLPGGGAIYNYVYCG